MLLTKQCALLVIATMGLWQLMRLGTSPKKLLPIFVENYLYKEVKKSIEIDCRIKDTPYMLDIIVNISNRYIITKDAILVAFDVVNIFPNIDVLGLETVSESPHYKESDFLPAELILDALNICLECNNCVCY